MVITRHSSLDFLRPEYFDFYGCDLSSLTGLAAV
jgi:hypothetical protein